MEIGLPLPTPPHAILNGTLFSKKTEDTTQNTIKADCIDL